MDNDMLIAGLTPLASTGARKYSGALAVLLFEAIKFSAFNSHPGLVFF